MIEFVFIAGTKPVLRKDGVEYQRHTVVTRCRQLHPLRKLILFMAERNDAVLDELRVQDRPPRFPAVDHLYPGARKTASGS